MGLTGAVASFPSHSLCLQALRLRRRTGKAGAEYPKQVEAKTAARRAICDRLVTVLESGNYARICPWAFVSLCFSFVFPVIALLRGKGAWLYKR